MDTLTYHWQAGQGPGQMQYMVHITPTLEAFLSFAAPPDRVTP